MAATTTALKTGHSLNLAATDEAPRGHVAVLLSEARGTACPQPPNRHRLDRIEQFLSFPLGRGMLSASADVPQRARDRQRLLAHFTARRADYSARRGPVRGTSPSRNVREVRSARPPGPSRPGRAAPSPHCHPLLRTVAGAGHQHGHKEESIPLLSRSLALLGPQFAWLEITGSCNLECRQCYAGSSSEGRTAR